MQNYVPLSQRPRHEIMAQAELYQEMSTTARTPQAKRGLEALAARLFALADRGPAAESRSRQVAHAVEAPSAPP